MKIAIIFTTLLVVTLSFAAAVYVQYLRNSLYGWTMDELEMFPPPTDIKGEWYNLSWAKNKKGDSVQPNPIRVIALAEKMADEMDLFHIAALMTSSFYSQVKYLLRMKQVPTAIAFYLEARKWRAIALSQIGTTEITAIEVETLGAPDFLLAVKWPIVGPLFFKKSALSYLLSANEILITEEVNPLTTALIWSKLWALTHSTSWQEKVFNAGLTRGMDEKTLSRISTHMGFDGSVDKLYEFLRI